MKIIHRCYKCKVHFEFYFNDMVPYSNKAHMNGKAFKAFDFQSIVGASKFVEDSKTYYSIHIIPCPHCDELNHLFYELME